MDTYCRPCPVAQDVFPGGSTPPLVSVLITAILDYFIVRRRSCTLYPNPFNSIAESLGKKEGSALALLNL